MELDRAESGINLEGLEPFVRWEPLRRVHGCIFGELAPRKRAFDQLL